MEAMTAYQGEDSCFDSPAQNLSWDDLEVGKLLGSGSFASVYKVKIQAGLRLPKHDFCTTSNEFENSSRTELTERSYSSSFSMRGDQDGLYYALKVLNEDIIEQGECWESRRSQAAIEGLKFEAQLLSELPRQDHIIHLIGLSSDLLLGDPTSSSPQNGMFLVLERLTETLDQSLKRWKTRKTVEKYDTSLLLRLVSSFGGGEDPEQSIRAHRIGLGIADAMSFLHQHQVVYRDLKPDNIGFDSQDTVKLFDFGLARKLDNESRENRTLTLQVGTLRYMSPEVFLGSSTSRSCDGALPYSYSTDVYSFAILLWEIVTLKKPFGKARTLYDLTKMVFLQHRRPNLRLVHSRRVRQLLQASWDPNPELRPSFAPIVAQLQQQQHQQHKKAEKKSKAFP